MQRKDLERIYKIGKRIRELEQVSEANIQISGTELRKLKEEYQELKTQFDIFADNLPCEICMLLELRYIYAWPYYMIRKHLYWVKEWNTNPREMIDEYFAEIEKKRKRKGLLL